jgi:hypothetical protein
VIDRQTHRFDELVATKKGRNLRPSGPQKWTAGMILGRYIWCQF